MHVNFCVLWKCSLQSRLHIVMLVRFRWLFSLTFFLTLFELNPRRASLALWKKNIKKKKKASKRSGKEGENEIVVLLLRPSFFILECSNFAEMPTVRKRSQREEFSAQEWPYCVKNLRRNGEMFAWLLNGCHEIKFLVLHFWPHMGQTWKKRNSVIPATL